MSDFENGYTQLDNQALSELRKSGPEERTRSQFDVVIGAVDPDEPMQDGFCGRRNPQDRI